MSVFVSKAFMDGFNYQVQWLSKDGEFDVLHSSKSYHANATLGRVDHHLARKGFWYKFNQTLTVLSKRFLYSAVISWANMGKHYQSTPPVTGYPEMILAYLLDELSDPWSGILCMY